jgi:hypothetical protein
MATLRKRRWILEDLKGGKGDVKDGEDDFKDGRIAEEGDVFEVP